MEERVRWSTVLVVPRGDQFIALARGFQPRDTNFPGGSSAPEDTCPEETAIRQLYEETGLRTTSEDMRLIDESIGEHGQPVYAYFVTTFSGRARSGCEGKVFWTAHLARLTSRYASHGEHAKRLLQKLQRVAA